MHQPTLLATMLNPYALTPEILEQAREEIKEKTGYYSVLDAVSEVKSRMVVDLSKYVLRLPAAYLKTLEPSPEGVYMYNALEPAIVFDGKGFFSHKQMTSNPSVPDIYNYQDMMKYTGPIYNSKGDVVFVLRQDSKKFLRAFPTVNRSAIYLLMISIHAYFSRLGKGFSPMVSLSNEELDPKQYIRPECYEEYDEYLNNDIDIVISDIISFIGLDTMCCIGFHSRTRH